MTPKNKQGRVAQEMSTSGTAAVQFRQLFQPDFSLTMKPQYGSSHLILIILEHKFLKQKNTGVIKTRQ